MDQAETLAQELDVSRSRLFVMAVEEFIRKYENERLLESLNSAYEEPPTPEEKEYLERMRRYHGMRVEGQW